MRDDDWNARFGSGHNELTSDDAVLIKAMTAHQDATHFTGVTRSFATLVLCLQDAR